MYCVLSALERLDAALTAVLTLAEGLDRSELARAPLTRAEIRRQLGLAIIAVEGLWADSTAPEMPELDPGAWSRIASNLACGGQPEQDAIWYAIQQLAPATLGWCRVYLR